MATNSPAPIVGEIEMADKPVVGEVEVLGPKPEVSFIGGLKAGLTAQPGEGVGHFIGAAIPATIGGALGSVVPGGGTVVGASLGEAARQAAGAIASPEATAKKSPLAIGTEVIAAGVGQKAGELAGPLVGKGVSKASEAIGTAADWISSKIGKSFLKAAKTLNAYGHLPEKAIKDEGIIATSWDNLVDKAKALKHDIGQEIDEVITKAESDVITNADDVVAPIDSALVEAQKFPSENATLITRLEGLKSDTIKLLKKGADKGQMLNSERANAIKKSLYKVTKYSGNNSDDIPLNKVKQDVARTLAQKIEDVTPEIKPLNERYGNLVALENAATNRAVVAQRGDIIGLPEMFGGGIAATGNIGAGAGLIIANRALRTPLGATAAMSAAKAIENLAKSGIPAKVVESAISKIGGGVSVGTIAKGLDTERADHPEIPVEYLPTLVADELKADPKFYD